MFVVLSRVEEITDDAIVVLLSYMILFKEKDIDFNGNYPKTKEAARKLKQSGFFDYLFKKGKKSILSKSQIIRFILMETIGLILRFRAS